MAIAADNFNRLRQLVIDWRNAMDDRIGSRKEELETDQEREEYLAIIAELENFWERRR